MQTKYNVRSMQRFGSPSTVSRAWVFTTNNPDLDQVARIKGLKSKPDSFVTEIVVGHETGASGTPHHQGFIAFSKSRTRRQVSELLGGGSWLQACASRDAAARYARKDGSVVVDDCQGVHQGRRTDLSTAIATMKQGGLQALYETQPEVLLKFPSGCRLLCSLGRPSGTRQVRVIVLHGPTGTGKSHRACVGDYFAPCLPQRRGDVIWFDRYQGQKRLVLEEMTGQPDYRTMLRILDKYPMTIPVKGGFVEAHWEEVYITSNLPPDRWYTDEDYGPLHRRFSEIIHMTTRWSDTQPEQPEAQSAQ